MANDSASGNNTTAVSHQASKAAARATARRRIRLTWRGGLATLALSLFAICLLLIFGWHGTGFIHQIWIWFTSSPIGVDNSVLSAIAGVAVVIWTGGLIAFNLRERYSADLSNGMWMLVFAFTAPLCALVVSGAALRIIATIAMISFGTVAALQVPAWLALRRAGRNKPLKMKGRLAFADGSPPPISAQEAQQMVERWVDTVNRVLVGGIFTTAAAVMSFLIFAFANASVVACGSLLFLICGLILVYQVLTERYRVGDGGSSLSVFEADAMPPELGAESAQRVGAPK